MPKVTQLVSGRPGLNPRQPGSSTSLLPLCSRTDFAEVWGPSKTREPLKSQEKWACELKGHRGFPHQAGLTGFPKSEEGSMEPPSLTAGMAPQQSSSDTARPVCFLSLGTPGLGCKAALLRYSQQPILAQSLRVPCRLDLHLMKAPPQDPKWEQECSSWVMSLSDSTERKTLWKHFKTKLSLPLTLHPSNMNE